MLDEQRNSRSLQMDNDLFALEQKRSRTAAENVAKVYEDAIKQRDSLEDQVLKQRDANEEIGLTKEQLGKLTSARLVDLAVRKESDAQIAEGLDMSGKLADVYRQQAAALRDRAVAAEIGGVKNADADAIKKAGEELKQFLDPAKAESFGDSLKNAFGGASGAISKLTSALQGYGTKQAQIDKARGDAALLYLNGKKTEAEYTKDVAALNEHSVRNQLAGYGDMTGAAAGFFGEQSKGYKALQAASQLFHAAELAMTIAELVPKGISAVLGQGQGDPYTAFGRMAAMAAIVTGLGVAIGGGAGSSNGQSAADVQKTQGTGTVFGDSSAKSDSISKSLALIEKNTYQGLDYSAGMLESLRAIESSLVGLNNLVIRTPGVTDGSNLSIPTGQLNKGAPTDAISSFSTKLTEGLFGPGLGGKIAGFINNLWSKTTQNIVDSGIQFGGKLSDLQSGRGFDQYASVDTTKSSWFGLSKSTSNSVKTAGLSDELSSQFGLIFTNLENTLKGAALGLGLGADQVSNSLQNLVVDVSKVSLKGLSGDALTGALNAVISKAMDQISEAAFPSFDAFRRVGEGYAETVIRIAGDFQAIDVVFNSIGKTFGKVGLESIAAREHLIDLSGGLEKFTSQAEFFLKTFFSEADQVGALKTRIQPTLTQFGLSTDGPGATKAFKDVVVGLDTTTEAGARAYTELMRIAPAFDQVAKAAATVANERRGLDIQLMEALGNAEGALAARRKDALDALLSDAARVTQSQIYAAEDAAKAIAKAQESASKVQEAEVKARADAQALVDTARNNLSAAYQRESGALQTVADRFRALGTSLREFKSGLLIGTASPLNDKARLDEARLQFENASTDKLQGAAGTFLQLQKESGGSALEYAQAFAKVSQRLDGAASMADGQVRYAEMQLEALTQSVTGQITLNESVLSVRDAILQLRGLGAGPVVGTAPAGSSGANYATALRDGVDLGNGTIWDSRYGFFSKPHGSHAGGLDYVPFDGYRAELHQGERVQTAADARKADASAKEMDLMRTTMSKLVSTSEKMVDILGGIASGQHVLITEAA